MADPAQRLDDLDRHCRRRCPHRGPLRRYEGHDLGGRCIRDVRSQRSLAREHPDARADDRGCLALPSRRDPTGHRRGTIGPLPARDHAGSRRHADHPGVRLPDANRDPLLSRSGCCSDHDDDLRHTPRDPDHRPRHPRRLGKYGRGRAGDGVHETTDPAEGAAAARTTDAAPRRQSDDSVRSLDGRHRRADRRQGPRRRRDERAELVPRPRDPRWNRDRRDGDGTRPDHRGRRRPYGSDSPPSHAGAPTPAPSRFDRDGGHIGGGSCRRPNVRRLRRLLALDRPRLDSRPDPVGARLHSQSGHGPLQHHELDRRHDHQVRAPASAQLSSTDALVHRARGLHRDRTRV